MSALVLDMLPCPSFTAGTGCGTQLDAAENATELGPGWADPPLRDVLVLHVAPRLNQVELGALAATCSTLRTMVYHELPRSWDKLDTAVLQNQMWEWRCQRAAAAATTSDAPGVDSGNEVRAPALPAARDVLQLVHAALSRVHRQVTSVRLSYQSTLDIAAERYLTAILRIVETSAAATSSAADDAFTTASTCPLANLTELQIAPPLGYDNCIYGPRVSDHGSYWPAACAAVTQLGPGLTSLELTCKAPFKDMCALVQAAGCTSLQGLALAPRGVSISWKPEARFESLAALVAMLCGLGPELQELLLPIDVDLTDGLLLLLLQRFPRLRRFRGRRMEAPKPPTGASGLPWPAEVRRAAPGGGVIGAAGQLLNATANEYALLRLSPGVVARLAERVRANGGTADGDFCVDDKMV